jgi:hypothetical protein
MMDSAEPRNDSSLRTALAQRGLRLEGEAGRGGMATVYQAYDLRHDRRVAVKVLRHHSGLAAERLLREIQLAAPLSHPHIVPIYDSGQVEGVPYLVMPLIEGESLRDRLLRDQRLPVEDAVRIARDVADALSYAHTRGVIHRDIKPENILLSEGHALVTDFGVALAARRNEPTERRLTDEGLVVGTAEYMSPEQASGESALDGRSDIYSLGCVLYEMLTGASPFSGSSAREVLTRRFRDPLPNVRDARPEVSPTLQRAIATALSFDPGERFATASGFIRALNGEATPPRLRLAGPGRAWPLVAVAAVVVVGFLLWPYARRSPLDPHRVVVGTFSNETALDSMNYLGVVTAARIREALAATGVVTVATSATVLPSRVDPGLVRDTLDDPQRVRALGVETGSGLVVSGSYYRDDRQIKFLCEITDVSQGRMVRAIGPIEAPLRDPQAALDSVSAAVATALRRLFPGGPPTRSRPQPAGR